MKDGVERQCVMQYEPLSWRSELLSNRITCLNSFAAYNIRPGLLTLDNYFETALSKRTIG